jgi:hypothetical protein
MAYSIRIEAGKVDTESGVCPGVAKTQQCERHVLTGRAHKASSAYANSFKAIYPMVLAVRQTEEMGWEEEDSFETTCPQGKMT